MRRVKRIGSLRSAFSRTARRVGTFFGWRDRDAEAEQEAAALTAAGQRADKVQIKKMKNGEGNGEDGGGTNDSGNDAMPAHKSKRKKDNELDERDGVDDGFYANGRPSDFAIPPNMSVAEWRRKQQHDRQAREEAEKTAEKQRKVNVLRKQEHARTEQDRRNQRQRVIREKEASKKDGISQPSEELRLRVRSDGLYDGADETYGMEL